MQAREQVTSASGLVYVVWELTLKCDLACGHCGSRAGKPRDRELETAEALDLVEQLADMGAREVTLIGGEAYLRDDWHLIARAIKQRGMVCSMTTGGRGMTLERARLAADAKLDNVSVSLDGMGSTHDRQRGLKGSFDAAVRAIANLTEAGVAVSVNTQVNKLTFPELDPLLDLLIDRKLHAWQVQLTVPMGRAADRPEWLLQPDDLLAVIPKLGALAVRGAAAGVRMWPGNNIGYFGPHEATIRGRGEKSERRWSGCAAGVHTLGVESDGAIKGCPSLPTAAYTGGNVRERPVREIWQHAPELTFVRERTLEDLWGYCKTCYYADECRGGCTWTAHVFFGKPGNNPYCHHRALEFEKHGLRERLVHVEAAPGTPFDHGRFEIVVEPLGATTASDGIRRRLPIVA
jgi:radical SAM protein with 4Fe4S-binding SPASM domain